jgi:hypothetical protein
MPSPIRQPGLEGARQPGDQRRLDDTGHADLQTVGDNVRSKPERQRHFDRIRAGCVGADSFGRAKQQLFEQVFAPIADRPASSAGDTASASTSTALQRGAADTVRMRRVWVSRVRTVRASAADTSTAIRVPNRASDEPSASSTRHTRSRAPSAPNTRTPNRTDPSGRRS